MSIEEIKSNLNKKFKIDNLLTLGSELERFERIPFTSPRLNYLTRGGIPIPGCVEISGPEGSGKTTLLGDLIKNAQALGHQCAFIDTENKTALDYWEWLGVDIDNLLVCKPTGVSGEDILQLQLELFEQGVTFSGLDSVASLVPKDVLTGDMNDKKYCGSSGIMSTFSQKLGGSGILKEKRACLVGINQVRDKINGFGFQTPAGHFWRHACIARLQISRGNPFDEMYKELPLGTTEEISGYTMEVRMLKNQFCKNDRRFNQCSLHFTHGIDKYEDIIEVGINLGVIHKGGAWYRLVNLSTGEFLCIQDEELKFQGKANLREYLRETPRIMRWLETQVDNLIKD